MPINLNDLTYGQLEEIYEFMTDMQGAQRASGSSQSIAGDLVGKYVIVRCNLAGVHAGILEAVQGNSCLLSESRRLWYWKPANNEKFLSGVAHAGLHPDSRVGVVEEKKALSEWYEITQTTAEAANSIRGIEADRV